MSSSDPTRVKSNYIPVETMILRQIERCHIVNLYTTQEVDATTLKPVFRAPPMRRRRSRRTNPGKQTSVINPVNIILKLTNSVMYCKTLTCMGNISALYMYVVNISAIN